MRERHDCNARESGVRCSDGASAVFQSAQRSATALLAALLVILSCSVLPGSAFADRAPSGWYDEEEFVPAEDQVIEPDPAYTPPAGDPAAGESAPSASPAPDEAAAQAEADAEEPAEPQAEVVPDYDWSNWHATLDEQAVDQAVVADEKRVAEQKQEEQSRMAASTKPLPQTGEMGFVALGLAAACAIAAAVVLRKARVRSRMR